MKNRKVIIVGESNLCRSFMAETILRGVLQKRNIHNIDVVSKGLVVLFPEPVAPNALEVLLNNGYSVSEFQSSQLTEEDLASADLVLTVTKKLADSIKEHYNTPVTCMFLGMLIDQNEDIPEASGDLAAYEESFQTIQHSMEAVADRLIGELLA